MPIIADQLEGSPALAPFMRNYAALIEEGFARPYTAHNGKAKVLYERDVGSDVVKGGIVYTVNQDTDTAWIVFSFVEPEFRRQGVYTRLHARLEHLLREQKIGTLASHVHVRNLVRQASCEKVGMVPEFYRMNKQL